MKEQLRQLHKRDLNLLFEWRNHPTVRRNSFDTSEIYWKDHEKWFVDVLNNEKIISYILEVYSKPVGVIRFDFIAQEVAKINYLIDPTQHGKGYGTKIVQLGVPIMFKNRLNLKKVFGLVLKENLASIKIFRKLCSLKL